MSSPAEAATRCSDPRTHVDLEMGRADSVVRVLPGGPAWPLPLYEFALLTAERAKHGLDPQITFITPEGRPLKAFGQAAGDAIVRLLEEARIRAHTGVVARVPAPGLGHSAQTQLEADRSSPCRGITGRALKGMPAGTWGWFVPDRREHRVARHRRLRASSLATPPTSPRQAGRHRRPAGRHRAAGIAPAGVGERPPPFEPAIRGHAG